MEFITVENRSGQICVRFRLGQTEYVYPLSDLLDFFFEFVGAAKQFLTTEAETHVDK